MRATFKLPISRLHGCYFAPSRYGDDIAFAGEREDGTPVRFRFYFTHDDVVCRMPERKNAPCKALEDELLQLGFFTERVGRGYRINTEKILNHMGTVPLLV